MGVRGLWEVAKPVARPVTLESLENKRLAIDASIWIYQFLKAVRDREGNALKSAHVIGFFRRICKLIFFGIKPVFVFDGSAPILKKQTLTRRRLRREGKQRDATHSTAKKLLAMQLQKMSDKQDEASRKKVLSKDTNTEEILIPENVVYYDQRHQPPARHPYQNQGPGNKPFRAQDQYHLPEVTYGNHIDSNDPRLMTDEELAEYAREFGSQISSGLYDTSLVDFDSAEFQALPITTQYQLLNTARLRSRLRMGQTAEQLDELFPDRMEFSKFQIQRVAQRNYLTQRILGLMGLGEDLTRRVSGEKGKEYILKRSDNGYTLALTSEPIDIDKTKERHEEKDEGSEEDDDFEDVPLTGLDVAKTSQRRVIGPDLSDSFGPDEDESNDIMTVNNIAHPNVAGSFLFTAGGAQENDELHDATEARRPSRSLTAGPRAGIEALDSFETRLQRQKMFADKNLKFDWSQSFLFAEEAAATATPSMEVAEEPTREQGEVTSDDKEKDNKEKASVELPPWFLEASSVEGEAEEMVQVEKESEESGFISFADAQRLLRRGKAEKKEQGANEAMIKQGEGNQTVEISAQEEEEAAEKLVPPSEKRALEFNKGIADKTDDVKTSEKQQSFRIVLPEGGDEYTKPAKDIEVDNVSSAISKVDEAIDLDAEIAAAEALDPREAELAEEDEHYDKLEEEELQENLEQEAEETEQFIKELNKGSTGRKMTHEDYRREVKQYSEEQNKALRDADEVTQTMVSDCQELLRYFGIPYITAPMEAEAQCAKLFQLGLVDGIVTDDSDCFLFGGSMVYKNMFNQGKYVECYQLKDLEQEFALDRRQLINLAQLLGSDYTDGLPGVGPVTALELLAEFNNDGGLVRFREWWNRVQTELDRESELCNTTFRRQFKKKFMTKLFLNDSFPDENVTKAYTDPIVDADPTAFEWGTPDLDHLRTYLMSMTGWSQEKVDEILVPVIQNINKKKQSRVSLIQTTIDTLPARKRMEITGSKRMRNAMESLIDQANKRKRSSK